MAASACADVLLEAVALLPHESTQSAASGNVSEDGYKRRPEPQRTVAAVANACDAKRHDQCVAEATRVGIYQRPVGQHSLPGYGPELSVNRPVRTRMPGGVGAGGEIPPATRLDFYDSNSLFETPDWRIMDCSVPVRSSEWLGTGTVTVVLGSCFCITIWLPRWRISINP